MLGFGNGEVSSSLDLERIDKATVWQIMGIKLGGAIINLQCK